MNKLIPLIIIFLVLIFVLSSCGISIEDSFADIAIGENFGNNIDGHQKKLPHNYCLNIDIGEKAILFQVPDNLLNVPYFSNFVYNTSSIIEGRYIKGCYNDDILILCEQTAIEEFKYIVFDFITQKVISISEKELSTYQTNSWFPLCNTIEQKV